MGNTTVLVWCRSAGASAKVDSVLDLVGSAALSHSIVILSQFIRLLGLLFGMLLAWRRPKIWCSPSWFPMFGMGMQQIIWIYMDIYRDLYIDVAHTWLIM